MLSPRSAIILKSIVEHYIDKAVPVPSQSIIHAYGLDVSSATVRNEMMRLEEEGYIIRPHTSAGSIPSDKGYRFYVETLHDIHLPINQQRMVSHLFHQVESRVDEWVRLTATMLSHMAQNMAVVATARASKSAFKHLEMVSIQEKTALLVLVLHGVRVRQQLITFPRAVSQDELALISARLNSTIAGSTGDEIEAKNMSFTEDEKPVIDTVVAIMKNEDTVTFEEPYLEGLQFMFGQPEFSNPQNAHSLVDLLEQKNLIRTIFPHRFEEPGVHVIIGAENETESIRGLSVIISRYGIPGEAVGCIAVVGPTRMSYPITIASVDYMAVVLTKLIARLYGKEITSGN
jgi:heat-inducible transcriptional repressor